MALSARRRRAVQEHFGSSSARSGLSIRAANTSSFDQLIERAQNWSGELDATLRAELGAAARDAERRAERAALRLRLTPTRQARFPQAHRSTGLRSSLSRSVKVELRAAGAGVTYRITTSHPMAHATNKARFNHPVHGDRENWVSQNSQPWWNLAMRESAPSMRQAADRALQRALRRL